MLRSDAQSCPTLCDSMDCSPPGSSVHGILQARVAMPSSRGFSQPRSLALQADSLPTIHYTLYTLYIHLRYADDTTLMAESEEELKSLLMKVKERVKKLA